MEASSQLLVFQRQQQDCSRTIGVADKRGKMFAGHLALLRLCAWSYSADEDELRTPAGAVVLFGQLPCILGVYLPGKKQILEQHHGIGAACEHGSDAKQAIARTAE